VREWITSLIIHHKDFRTTMYRNILRFPYEEFESMLPFLQFILLCFFTPGLRKPPAHDCYYQRIPGRTFFAHSSIKDKIERGFSSIAYAIFVPIFFINIGLSANVRQVPIEGLIFLAGMLVVVVISKLVGAGLGGRLGGWRIRESVQLGFGMIPRGEVVLIIAAIGITEGLIDSIVFSTIVMLVIITSLITPPLLQMVFSTSKGSN
jgi:hypothetical protein